MAAEQDPKDPGRVESSPGPILALSGTTASSKNRTAVELAERLGGEILSLDSMKVYRGMDRGTDKPDAALRARIPHHLVDVIDPHEPMNLRRFVDRADEALADIRSRGRQPIAVGGTAMYLMGFLRGVFEGPDADPEFRARLRAEAEELGTAALHERLQRVDPEAGQRIHPNDLKRIERALEVYALTGQPISAVQGQWKEGPPRHEHQLFILTWPRPLLDARIDARVEEMVSGGLLEEVRAIEAGAGFGPQSADALGYAEARSQLQGAITVPEMTELIQRRTRRFARRQLTWFRGMKQAQWVEAQGGDQAPMLADRIERAWRAGEGSASI